MNIHCFTKCEKRKGFTLIELILVLAILGIMMLIAQVNFSVIVKQVKVKADIRTAQSLIEAYRLKHISEGLGPYEWLEKSDYEDNYINSEDIIKQNKDNDSRYYICIYSDSSGQTKYSVVFSKDHVVLKLKPKDNFFVVTENSRDVIFNTKPTKFQFEKKPDRKSNVFILIEGIKYYCIKIYNISR